VAEVKQLKARQRVFFRDQSYVRCTSSDQLAPGGEQLAVPHLTAAPCTVNCTAEGRLAVALLQNDMFSIPTFQEYIDLALSAKRVVGM
jgi:hypothetical protein